MPENYPNVRAGFADLHANFLRIGKSMAKVIEAWQRLTPYQQMAAENAAQIVALHADVARWENEGGAITPADL